MHLRTGLPHAALAELYGTARSTVSRAISVPPKKPKDDAPLGEQYAWREMRRRQSSAWNCVGARQCRTAAVAPAPAVHRPARGLRRNPCRDRLTGLGSLCPSGNPPQAEH
ncbi:hypothetical protein [Streptomyces sp. NPDC059616]|uniref:hypothetical protein n=2 Tax=unclassified Streptomyces TaxID=2593676 RepID=UPI0036A4AA4E